MSISRARRLLNDKAVLRLDGLQFAPPAPSILVF